MRTDGAPATHIVRTRLVNSTSQPLTVRLEPWGDEFIMAPEMAYDLVAEGPGDDTLELAYGSGDITVWGWPGSVVRVLEAGVELDGGRWERAPVPSMPPLKGPEVGHAIPEEARPREAGTAVKRDAGPR